MNGGGLSNVAQSRSTRNSTRYYRFDSNSFKSYLKNTVCCKDALTKGTSARLATFKDGKKVRGTVRFISRNFVPVKFACPKI